MYSVINFFFFLRMLYAYTKWYGSDKYITTRGVSIDHHNDTPLSIIYLISGEVCSDDVIKHSDDVIEHSDDVIKHNGDVIEHNDDAIKYKISLVSEDQLEGRGVLSEKPLLIRTLTSMFRTLYS